MENQLDGIKMGGKEQQRESRLCGGEYHAENSPLYCRIRRNYLHLEGFSSRPSFPRLLPLLRLGGYPGLDPGEPGTLVSRSLLPASSPFMDFSDCLRDPCRSRGTSLAHCREAGRK